MSQATELGPVQLLVVEFLESKFTGEIIPELRRLQDEGILKVIDLLVVRKEAPGQLTAVEVTGLGEDERVQFGSIARSLAGFDDSDEAWGEDGAVAAAAAEGELDESSIWAIEDSIPVGAAAAVAVLEHRWAIPLRDAIQRAGGVAFADEWLHPQDLSVALAAASASA